MNKQEILNELIIKLHDYPFILFDDAVEMPSLNNSIKKFSGGDPIWEDMPDDDIELVDASEVDLSNLLYETERQIEKDDKLIDRWMDAKVGKNKYKLE